MRHPQHRCSADSSSGSTVHRAVEETWLQDELQIRHGITQAERYQTNSCKLDYCIGDENPWAALLINKRTSFVPSPELITKDLAVVVRIPLREGTQEIIVASAYCPGDTDVVPPNEVAKIVRHHKGRKIQLLLGCDVNMDHTLWGSRDIN